ncbi:MAG: hypothetical protein NTY07_08755 [Bacteroidia bacterium]|nr:hypothetical protein [Bacteroidia bacterium]
MENNKPYNNEYLNKVYEKLLLTDSDEILSKDGLKLFCEFISSNPDFKYNRTYLTDSIDIFFDALTNIRQRIATFKRIVSRIKRHFEIEKDVSIVFDDFFEYNIKDFPVGHFRIINAERFRFDKVTKDDCIIRFIWKIEDSIKKNEVYHIDLNDKKNIDILWEDFKMTIEKL